MTSGSPSAACRTCGRHFPAGSLDRAGLCAECRETVVRRATRWGQAAGVAALLLGAGLWIVLAPSRFLVLWLVLLAGVYFFTYKIVRRASFQVIRDRQRDSTRDNHD